MGATKTRGTPNTGVTENPGETQSGAVGATPYPTDDLISTIMSGMNGLTNVEASKCEKALLQTLSQFTGAQHVAGSRK